MGSNPMRGGFCSNVQPSILGLEMSLHHNLPPQNPQAPHHMSQQHPAVAFSCHDGDYQPQQFQQSAKQAYPKSKNQSFTLSDDEEPGFSAENSADDGKRKVQSQWQRMKWTDNMVRLLIMVVFYIGDEVGSEAASDPASKKKGGSGGGGVLQKKGKWKSVSMAMMERGFYVSPQQCEDKFNDLNKRYKRVNDILGKGTSCRVVENQALLDSMDLSPKVMEEVKKLLNSKHLFFREMCAYHNSCGHGSGSGSGSLHHSPTEAAAEASQPQQRCLHLAEKASSIAPNLNTRDESVSKLVKATTADDDDADDDEDEDEEEDEDVDDDEVEHHEDRKRARKMGQIQELNGEIMKMIGDGSKSSMEKRVWLKRKMMAVEEERVGIQSRTLELEKQRLKWLKFSSKKEREMERERVVNERLRLENERMVMLIRQKELDLMDHHHQSNNKNDPSSITG